MEANIAELLYSNKGTSQNTRTIEKSDVLPKGYIRGKSELKKL